MRPTCSVELRAYNRLARHTLQYLAGDFITPAVPVSERVLKVEPGVIKRIGVDVEDMGDSNTWCVAGVRVLNNHVKWMLDDAISAFLMSDLVEILAKLIPSELAGGRRLVACSKHGGSGRRGGKWRR